LYQIHLDNAGRLELIRRTRLPKLAARTRDRLEMVRLSDAGWSVPRIAAHLGAHHQTVRYWIKAFLTGGFDALDDRRHTGQRSAITEEILAAVRERIGQADRSWTAQQVADWVTQHYQITRSAKQWRKLLTRLRQSYKRTARSLHHKQKPDKVQAVAQEMSALEQKGGMNCSISATLTRQEWP
jgi:putative transposase